MSKAQKSVPSSGGSAIVLQATNTQPMQPFRTEDAIDSTAVVDDGSAIDQFVQTIEELNIVISRHSVILPIKQQVEPVSDPPTPDGLESLLSLNGSEREDDGEPDDTTSDADLDPSNLASDDDSPGLNAASSADDEVTIQLNNLIFLGYMSAVESYFRCLTRQLIWADDLTASKVNDLKISFGAARHADPKLLPEVLMEDMTFITLDSVKNLLNAVIGVGVNGVVDVIDEYDRICQLRHCIVHRFGRLGSKNATKLGLRTHKSLFEKKIKISSRQLEELRFSLLNFVRALNNHIYANVLERSAKYSDEWKWNLEEDIEAFDIIYSVFRKTRAPGESVSSARAYQAFKDKCERGSATQVQLARQKKGFVGRSGAP